MSRRRQRNRCYVCSVSVDQHVFKLSQFSFAHGWHVVYPLCRICYKAIVDIVEEAAREYR